MATTVANLTAIISANNTKFKKGVGGAQSAMSGFSKSVNKMGAAILPFAGVTAGVFAVKRALSDAGRVIMDFEQAMADVKAVTRASKAEFADLSNSAKKLGGTTKFTASEVAGLQKEFGKLGFTTQEIIDASEATLDLAAATGTELARAAEVSGITIRQFGLDAKETVRVVDLMTGSFSRSALDTEKFAEAMKMVGPDARKANISLEETTAMLAVLANAGISGTMAGTALRKILVELAGTGGSLTEKFEELSRKGLTLADANDEVGARAKTSLLVLLDQLDTLPKLTTEFENLGGAAKEMADVQLNTLRGQLVVLRSAYEGFILKIADSEETMDGFKKAITSVAEAINFITDNVDKFRQFKEENADWLKIVKMGLNPLKQYNKEVWNFAKTLFQIKKGELANWGDDDIFAGFMEANPVEIADKVDTVTLAIKNFDSALKETATTEEDIDIGSSLIELGNRQDGIIERHRKWKIATRETANATDILDGKMADMNATMEAGFTDDMSDSLRDYKNQINQLGQQLGNLASVLASDLAFAFGEAAAGMDTLEDSLAGIGIMIANSLGDILIAAGVAMGFTPLGLSLIALGLGAKGIAGLASGSAQMSRDSNMNAQPVSGGLSGSMLYGNDIRTAYDYSANTNSRVG